MYSNDVVIYIYIYHVLYLVMIIYIIVNIRCCIGLCKVYIAMY